MAIKADLKREIAVLRAENKRPQVALDEAQLRSIEARNPGIDLDLVRESRRSSTPKACPKCGEGVLVPGSWPYEEIDELLAEECRTGVSSVARHNPTGTGDAFASDTQVKMSGQDLHLV